MGSFSSLTVNRFQSSQSITMNSAMIVLAALMTVAAGEPHHTVLGYSGAHAYAPLGYSAAGYHPYNGIGYAGVGALPYAAHHVSPLAYGAAHVAPLAYSTEHVAPVAYAAAPVAYAAAPVAPVAYTTGHRVEATYEPVEQHGYQVVY